MSGSKSYSKPEAYGEKKIKNKNKKNDPFNPSVCRHERSEIQDENMVCHLLRRSAVEIFQLMN